VKELLIDGLSGVRPLDTFQFQVQPPFPALERPPASFVRPKGRLGDGSGTNSLFSGPPIGQRKDI
jgi:hypothetical protein